MEAKQSNLDLPQKYTFCFIVMGVSGCGKSTIGQKLQQKLNFNFYDGDNFHSISNKTKLANGIPLTDEDRSEWLNSIVNQIETCFMNSQSCIIACSALKESYRNTFRKILIGKSSNFKILFVFLKGSSEAIQVRLEQRRNHFMNPNLLASQFQTLEEPPSSTKEASFQDVLTISVDGRDVQSIVNSILFQLLEKYK